MLNNVPVGWRQEPGLGEQQRIVNTLRLSEKR